MIYWKLTGLISYLLIKNDPNHSFNSFETKINSLIDTYFPLKKLTNKEMKLQFKPWIIYDIRKSIQRDSLYKRFIKAKDIHIKDVYHIRYKKLRNQIVPLCRESKMLDYQQFFTENANNMKTTRVLNLLLTFIIIQKVYQHLEVRIII